MGTLRYIGSKARLRHAILDLLGDPPVKNARFVDVFAGTGVVSREAALRGWQIRANDHLISSAIMTTAQLCSSAEVGCHALGGYAQAVAQLNCCEPKEGFIYREYTPSGQSHSGQLRFYFTPENGRRIDGMRQRIERWGAEGKIGKLESWVLIADLMAAANSVANIAGTYGCFLRHWSPASQRPLVIQPRQLLKSTAPFEVLNCDAFDVPTEDGDLVYLDPPYTKRQYAAYYHILETIAAGDTPKVKGITGLRPWEEKSSLFCYKTLALKALTDIVQRFDSSRIAISYSGDGHVDLEQLCTALRADGHVELHSLGGIKRYQPNEVSRRRAANVTEYLICFTKTPVVCTVAA